MESRAPLPLTAMAAAASERIERRHYALAGLRAAGEAALLVFIYFVIPINHHARSYVFVRISVGLALFVATLVYEVQAILKSPRPMLRAVVAMALVLPLFILVFAWTYLTMSLSSPFAFSQRLDRISALYFAVTVFSTVGFGDIVARTDPARLAVTIQMILDLAVVAVVVRLIFGAARGTIGQRDEPDV
jgi:voltage-gated potassium channel